MPPFHRLGIIILCTMIIIIVSSYLRRNYKVFFYRRLGVDNRDFVKRDKRQLESSRPVSYSRVIVNTTEKTSHYFLVSIHYKNRHWTIEQIYYRSLETWFFQRLRHCENECDETTIMKGFAACVICPLRSRHCDHARPHNRERHASYEGLRARDTTLRVVSVAARHREERVFEQLLGSRPFLALTLEAPQQDVADRWTHVVRDRWRSRRRRNL